jgi:hypothetical protein
MEQFSRQYGPYPHSYLRLVENPVRNMGAHAEAATIDYGDDFSLLNPRDGPQGFDLVFAVIAHEVAHQWWGMQLAVPFVAGAGLLIEGVATYSAMQMVEQTLGPGQLRRYRLFMQEEYRDPRTRAAPPLLRSTDSFAYYRKGPFALDAVRAYIGKERVDEALRRLFEKHRTGAPPLPTTVDLYRELQGVTPESFQYLLHDLFEANTFWDLEMKRATAQQIAGGWQVTLDVSARKIVVDEAGVEKELPMDELVPIGVFAARAWGPASGTPLYLQRHRIRSGAQTITVAVQGGTPAEAGVDPDYLLHNSDGEVPNNVVEVIVER